jgi:hypothetical protein
MFAYLMDFGLRLGLGFWIGGLVQQIQSNFSQTTVIKKSAMTKKINGY